MYFCIVNNFVQMSCLLQDLRGCRCYTQYVTSSFVSTLQLCYRFRSLDVDEVVFN